MSNKPRRPDKRGKASFQLETLEKRILFSADLPFPVVELSTFNTTAHIGLVSAADSFAQSSTSPANSEQHSQRAVDIVIIDSATPEYASIVTDLEQQANSPLHVYILDADRDGIEQISEVLSQYDNVGALHLISHGADAQLSLGNATVDFTELLVRADDIAAWQNSFTADADFLIYGCDLASTDTGRSFVSTLGNLTGTDVAASDDLTGSALLGGDWELEYNQGEIETTVVISEEFQRNWTETLGVAIDSTSTGSSTGGSITISHTTSGSNTLMLVGVSMNLGGASNVSSITYNGDNLTLVGTQTNGDAVVEIWSLVNPDLGTHDVEIVFSASTDGNAAAVMTFAGVDQSSPLGTFSSNVGSGSSGSVSMSSTSDDLVFGMISVDDPSNYDLVPGGSQTEDWDVYGYEINSGGGTKAGAASVDMSWSWAGSDTWSAAGVSINSLANSVPTFGSVPVTSATEDTAYSYGISTSDVDGDPLTITAAPLPTWLTLTDNGDGTAALTGTPTNAEVGSHSVVLEVTDGAAITTQSFNIVVANTNDVPTFDTTPVTAATEDSAYSYAIATTDVDGDPRIITATTLPTWLTMTDNGDGTATLTGTPTNSEVGSHSVVLEVTDGTAFTTQSFSIVVANTNDTPNAADDRHGVDFDGVEDHVLIGTDAALEMSATMTIEAWINPDGSANLNTMIVNREGEYEVALASDNTIQWAFANADPGWGWHNTGVAVEIGEWSHIAVTYDNGDVATYLNGVQIDFYDGSGTIGDAHETLDEFRIGGRQNNPLNQSFDGRIAEVRIWDAARTGIDIAADMNTSLTGSESNLVGYWKLDENSYIATDFAGTNDGTLAVNADPSGYWVTEDAVIIETAPGVLENDYDADGDPLTISEVNGSAASVGNQITLASGALLTLNADGSFDYDPNRVFESLAAGVTTTDSFTYTATDGIATDTATVIVQIIGVNDAPTFIDGSVGNWNFNEGSGQSTAESAIGISDGTLGSTAGVDANDPTWTTGKFGQALHFNGVDEYIEIADAPGIDISGPEFSASLWMNPDSGPNTEDMLFMKGDRQGDINYYLSWKNSNEMTWAFRDGAGWHYLDMAVTMPTTGEWNHVAITFDRPTVTLYVNGTKYEFNNVATGGSMDRDLTANNEVLWIGAGRDGGALVGVNQFSGPFTGSIDEFALFDRALIEAEIDIIRTSSPPVVSASAFSIDENSANNTVVGIVVANDQDIGDSLSYAITAGNTDGAFSIDVNGQITVANIAALDFETNPTFNLTIEATDDSVGNLSDTTTVTITLNNVNDAPTFGSVPVTAATEDSAYSYAIATSDVDGDPLAITATTLPTWLTLVDNGDGTASLTGTPTNAEVGSHAVVLEVTDGTVITSQSFSVVVANTNDAPTFGSAPVTAATEDAAYSYAIATSDVDGDPLAITATTLPIWLTLVDNGDGTASLTGTPTNAEVGSHSVVLEVTDGTVMTSQNFSVVVANTNDAPTFGSVPVTAATEDSAYSYAIATSDVDGDPLAITATTLPTWLTLVDNGDGTASLTGTPTNAEVGSHSVVLEVTDGTVITSQSFSVVVANTNDAPTFGSVPVTAATEDSAYSYAIATSDVDGDPLAITATTLPTWLTLVDNGDGTASLTGTPTNAEVGSHSVVLEVTDGTVVTSQSFSVVVANTNDAPSFGSVPVTAATEDSAYSYAIATSDVDGDPLAITATTLPTWLTLVDNGDGTASLTGTPTNAEVGSHSVLLEVTDGTVMTSQNFSVVVANTNDAPTFGSAPVTAATEDTAYSYAIATSDVDGDPLAITATTLPIWLTLVDNGDGTASLTGTPTNAEVGSHSVLLEVTDGTAITTQSFSVVVANTNDAPTFGSVPVTAATEDSAYSYAIATSDVDGDPLAITATTLPTWLTLVDNGDGTASLTGTPTNAEVGSHSVVLEVSDGTVVTSQSFSVIVANTNDAPTFGSVPVTAATEDSAYSYAIATSDVDGDPLAITATTLPTWLTLVDNGDGTATLSGTPTNAEVGSHSVVLEVTDGTATTTQSFSVVVANTNDAPTFGSVPVTAATEDSAYSYAIATSDVDGDPLAITATTLPTWLTLVDNGDGTASLTGTPTNAEVGSHSVLLEVTDGTAITTQSFSVVVANTNDAPTFGSVPVTAATEDSAYSYAIATSDVDGDPLAITATTLPIWLTLVDNGDGTATLSGTPTNAEVGSHSVVLEVTDGTVVTSQSFSVVVANTNDAPSFGSVPVTAATEDSAYSYAIATSDVDGDPLAITATTLPTWLTLVDNGDGTATLSGTPTNAEVGSHSVVLEVTDGTVVTSQSFSVVVANTNDAPTFGSAPVTAATEDSAYSYAIATSDVDGDPLAITATTLPTWLTLVDNGDGTASLTGTPTNAEVGSHAVVLEVTDGTVITSQSFSVVVANTNDAPTFGSAPVTAATEDAAYSYAIATSDVDGDPLAITATTLPTWLTLVDNGDGTASLTGTPTNAEVGSHSVVLEVSDGTVFTSQSFSVVVANTNDAPTFGSAPVTAATEDSAYSYAIATSDVDGDPLAITATTLPTWLTLVDNGDGTATLSGTPTNAEVGSHSVVLEVTDGTAITTQSFSVVVANTNDAPTFGSVPVTAATEDSAYSYAIATSDVDGDPLAITATTLPTWLTLVDNGDGTASLTGTPTNAEVGSHSVLLEVTDGTAITTQSFSVVVANTNDAPTFGSVPVTAATEDSAYSYAIATSDVDGDPLAITATTLPIWLTLVDNGDGTATLSGTPTNAEVGSHSVVLEVTDGTAITTQSFSVVVANTNDAPTFGSVPVTAATEDSAYSYAIATSDVDGDPLAITATTLPTWLTLVDNGDGTASLTGTPTNAEVGSHAVVLEVTDGTVITSQSFSVVVANTNDAPTFGSAPVTAATEDAAYSYAIATSDVDGDPLAITATTLPIWLTLVDNGDGTASLTGTPTNAEVGSHAVVLEVTDGTVITSQSFSVVVANTNDAPTFGSAPVTAATEDAAYSYAIATSDVDGDPLAITATTLPTWLTLVDNGDGTASLTGTPTNAEVGSHSVVLEVSDGTVFTSQSFSVVVANTNDAPTFGSAPVTAATEDSAYSYAIATSDVDGDPLAITATTLPTWLTLVDNGDGTATLSGTPTNAEVGSHSVVLEVSDGTVVTSQSFSVVVANTNDAPTFGSAPVTAATEDSAYSYAIATSDVDGDPLAITATTLPTWLTLVDNGDGTASLTGTPTNAEVGSHSVLLEVTDGTAITTQSFSVVVANTNDAPTFGSVPATAATEDSAYSYAIATSDVDGDPLAITATTLPTWLTLVDNGDGTATLSGTPTNAEVGSHSVVLEVSDGTVFTSQSFSVVVANTNDAPTFGSAPVTAATEDSAYSYAIATSDVDGDPLAITATTLPTWLTLVDNGDGTASLTGTPTNAEVGSHSVLLEVTDGTAITTQSFSVVVANTNDAPTFGSVPATAATEDSAYSYAIATSDVDGDPLAITATTLPTWLTLVDNGDGTATLSGTPTNAEVGSHSVVLEVTDGTATTTQSFSVVVANTNDAPTFGSAPVTAATEDSAYSYAIATSDVDGDPLAITATTLPTWLTLVDNGDGTATLSGTPTNAEVGSHSVVLEVTDGTATTTQSFSVVVANTNDAPTFGSVPVTAATEDSAYSYAIATSDVDGDPLAITATTLPTWLTLVDNGDGTATLSGTPTNAEVGSHSVVLEVTDGTVVTSQSFSVVVANTNDAPSFGSVPVTAASEDAAYSYAIATSDVDGDPLAITATTLPTWLTLVDNGDGTASLTGTPTNAEVGSHSVLLEVTDGTAITTQSFSVVVANTNDAPTFGSVPVTAATEDSAYSYAIATSDVDGDPLAITATTLPTWLTLVDNGDGTATLSGTPTNAEVGSHSVVLEVTDGTVITSQSFSVVVANTNDAPTFGSVPVTAATEDSAYSYAIATSDVDGDPLAITATTLPTWLTLVDNGDGTATLTGTPTNAEVSSHSVVLEVTDGTVITSQSFSVVVANTNDAPTFDSAPVTAATEDAAYSYSIATSDVDGDPLAITATTLPTWLTLVNNGDGTATLSGTPTNAEVGSHSVVLEVTDGTVITSQSSSVVVANTNDAPTFDSAPVTAATEDSAYSYSITTSDLDGDPLALTATTLPTWLTLVDNGDGTASLTGTPTNAEVGSHSVVLEVTDGTVMTSQSFSVVVANTNDAPTFTSPVAFTVAENTSPVATLTSFDADGAAPTYTLVGTSDDSRFSIDAATGELLFATAPDFENPTDTGADNTYELTVQVSDGRGGFATQAIAVTVTDVNETPVFTSPTSFTLTENSNSVATISSIDDTGSAQRYSLVGAEDDNLFSIDSDSGALSFVASPDFESPTDTDTNNTYNLTVQVEDGTGLKATLGVTVAIENLNEAPSLATAELSTTEGFVGDIGQLIMTDPDAGDELTLSIVGGSAQAFFSVDPSSGAVSQQGSLAPGLYTLEVLLNDANGMSTRALLQIRIDAAEPDLGAANNTDDSSQPSLEPSDTTAEFSSESGYTPWAQNIDNLPEPGTVVIAGNDNTFVLESSGSPTEPSVQRPSGTSATGDTINSLFPAASPETHHIGATSQAAETDHTATQSRGYNVVLELLFGEAEEAFDELGSAFASVMDGSLFSITLTPDMLNAISSMHSEVDAQQQQADERLELILTAGTVASVTLTVGFVSWLLQTGSLLATALSTSPLWRAIDPVPVLTAGRDEEDDQIRQPHTGTQR